MRHFIRFIALAALLAGLTVSAGAATFSERQDQITQAALAYGEESYFGPLGIAAISVLPDVAVFTPGYIVAALRSGQSMAGAPASESVERANSMLKDLLLCQDRQAGSQTRGLFPPVRYNSAPSLSATCRLLPLLAWIVQHGQTLPEKPLAQTRSRPEVAYTAVKAKPAPPDQPFLPLLRAAALATAGSALGDPEGLNLAQRQVRDWLSRTLSLGCFAGHSPSGEALQLGALDWIAATGETFPELQAAQRLLYTDLVQRLQPGSGAVAGAAAEVEPADYAQGGELHRYLLHLWDVAPAPAMIRPSAMYFAACDHVPEELVSTTPSPLPRTLATLGKEPDPKQTTAVLRTDTYMTELFSLGTMSGALGPWAVPLMITLAESPARPTAYFFADGGPARVTSLQHGNVAAVSVNFLAAGSGSTPQAFLRGLLGPRREIKQVLVGSTPWPEQPAAVAQGSVVAVERGGLFLGFRLMLCGPALSTVRTEAAKPGVLQWQSEDPEAELELLIYARKQNYALPRPQAHLLAGVLVKVEPATAYPSLTEFSRAMAAASLRQTVSLSRELVKPQEDPATAVLRQNEPRMRSEYTVVPHLYHDLNYEAGELALHLHEDLVSGKLLALEAQGTPLAVAGPWESPLLSLPWDARRARASLTAGAQ